MNDLTTAAPAVRSLLTRADTDQQLVDEWLSNYKGNTLRLYTRVIDLYLDVLSGPLRRCDLEDHRQAMAVLGRGSKVSTYQTYAAAVKSFLSFGAKVGYLPFNPGPLLRIDKAMRTLSQRIISDVDMALLIRAAEGRDRLLIEVGYYGGLRVSELVSLSWGQVIERDAGMVQLAGLVGKGNKVREVLLPAFVGDRLKSYRGDKTDGPIFQAEKGHAGSISTRHALNIIKKAAKAAGLKEEISPHWLRHAHISHALDNGAPISLVSQSVGHASISTTSVYAHARPGDSSALHLKDLG